MSFDCNLRCRYCFYLRAEEVYGSGRHVMPDAVLEEMVRQMMGYRFPETVFGWQGGEPTLAGLDFFKRIVALEQKHGRAGQVVGNGLQTNATLIDDDWARFLARANWLVGVSLDGPKEVHNLYRRKAGGSETFHLVLRGLKALQAAGVAVNALVLVSQANVRKAALVYRFLRDSLQARFVQFIPIVERATAPMLPMVARGWGVRQGGRRPLYTQAGSLVTRRSVRADQYGQFLAAIFDEWVRRDVGTVFVQTFDIALGSWLGQPNLCIVSPVCGRSLALEHNGDLYACDHYVESGYLLGNILEQPLAAMVESDRQRQFGQDKLDRLPQYCRACEVVFACYGECPRNRFIETPDGESGLNYLCAGYRAFFNHISRPMSLMAELLRQGRPPAEIVAQYAAEDAAFTAEAASVGRNDACPCGSGKKAKHCHGRGDV